MDALRPRLHSLAGSLVSHRLLLYTLSSTVAVSAVIANALRIHSNFYSITVYLSKSGHSVLVLANFCILIFLVCGRILQHVFFGSLRPLEVERLYEQMRFSIPESLLAFTMFRDELDVPFAFMFGFLLFVKCFHWLMADRVEWMDQMPYPGPSTLFHLRINTLFCILWVVDFVMFIVALENMLANGITGMVLFASEYAILMTIATNSMLKYLLSVLELRRAASRGGENAPPWENKSMWVFYVELWTDFIKLATYLVFFAAMAFYYAVPLNLLRDIFMTGRSFITRLGALVRYHSATRNMDERYPNATEEEMTSMNDRTCIICREEMVTATSRDGATPATQPAAPDGPNMTPKKLPCGHIFHFSCLRSWLERQQSCPTCRHTVLETNPQPTRRPQQGATRAPAPQPGQAGAQARPQPPHGFGNALRGILGFPAPPAAQPPPLIPAGLHQFGHAGGQIPQNPWGQYPPPGYQPQHLQAPPVFHGFFGPGGVWQPWPLAPPDQAAAHPATNNAQAGPSTPSTAPTRTSSAPPDPTHHPAPAPNDTSPAVATTPRDQADEDTSGPSNPREAAAAAALRRFGSGSNAPERNDSANPRDQTARPTPTPTATNNALPPSLPGTSTLPNGFAQRPNVPSLIPLSHLPPTLAPNGAIGHQRPISSILRNYNDDNSTPSPLPPTLTDEQLSRLDTLTREAIDERLRILENISSAVQRCVDDLTRVRSVLPASSAADNGSARENGSAPETVPTSKTNETENSSSERAAEKKPEREPVVVSASSEEEDQA